MRAGYGTRYSTSDLSENTYSSISSDADEEALKEDERQDVNETNYELITEDFAEPNQRTSEKDKAIEDRKSRSP